MRRVLIVLALTVVTVALLAPPALATQSGQGTYGPVDDKTTTDVGFMLIGGFPLFILLMSLLQWRLDVRKERRKAATKAGAANRYWQAGW